MNKYRREVTIEIMVGLFMFIVLIALGIFTIVLSQENLLKKTYAYEFVFSEIGGLREGDNVAMQQVLTVTEGYVAANPLPRESDLRPLDVDAFVSGIGVRRGSGKTGQASGPAIAHQLLQRQRQGRAELRELRR